MKKLMKKFLISIICISMLAPYVPSIDIVWAEDSVIEPDSDGSTHYNGSGSYQLNSNPDDYRFYTEYYVTAVSPRKTTTAGIERRTTIEVYAKKDEYILFGSSVSDSYIDEYNVLQDYVTDKDIVMTTPILEADGVTYKKECFNVIAPNETRPFGYGYIANPTQEKNGPMVNHAEDVTEGQTTSDYYVPLTYKAPVDGIYTFEFHSRTGKNNGQTVEPVKAGKDTYPYWNQKDVAVAAWDVTVLGTKAKENPEDPTQWEVKSGRAWTNYLALTTGAAGNTESDLNVHVLSHDGYVYKVDFKKAVPFGFIFFANNTGFMTEVKDNADNVKNKVPIYHSFYDSSNDLDYMANENITLHKPNEADTDTEETYKIFFNSPSGDLDGYIDPVTHEKIKTKPADVVNITDLKFQGIGDPSDTRAIARAGQGGLFSFKSDGEATVTIRLDLRKAISDSKIKPEEYSGSGLVEITAFAHATSNPEDFNTFYWDGKDTEGVTIPAGIYGNQNVIISTEVKRGELHFPVIDMEGLRGGLIVERKSRLTSETDNAKFDSSKFDLYYNNNPLAYGTIEGNPDKVESGKYNLLSDGTKSFNIDTNLGGPEFFKNYKDNMSTLKKDDKYYIAEKLFGKTYDELDATTQDNIDKELREGKATFHFEPVNSSVTTMKFGNSSSNGGGNQAGIDAWTYYSQGVKSATISFAMLDNADTGLVSGQIFYDANKDSSYTTGDTSGDYALPNVKVRLMEITEDGEAKPATHTEWLPCFDDSGHFKYDTDGTVVHEYQTVYFDTVTDSQGMYRFIGVPYDTTKDTDYYVQVLLNDTQTEVLRYTCTTSAWVKDNLKYVDGGTTYFFQNNEIVSGGPDGCKMEIPEDSQIAASKIYKYKYSRIGEKNETVFDKDNTTNIQKITFYKDTSQCNIENDLRKASFKSIGYCSTVPTANQWNYTVKKEWGTTHQISDGVTVELWVWNDSAVKEENMNLGLSRRTGALVDTQVLHASVNPAEDWTYTWKNLDNRLQYYVLEYYTKKKANGDIIYNDHGEPRMVLIGGTMPIFGEVPEDKMPTDANSDGIYEKGIYGFEANLSDYPEKVKYLNDQGEIEDRIPIQYFGDGKSHSNSITNQEKLESVDNNARQYKVTYELSSNIASQTNTITLHNNQVYDDRTYYVWLNHETMLPDMIGQTFVKHEGGVHQLDRHAVELIPDGTIEGAEGDNTQRIKGLSVSSVDAAKNAESGEHTNFEGNATDAFRIKTDADGEEKAAAFFTATNHGNYKTGTGTRTYRVKYVVDATTKDPVSVQVNGDGKLVLASDGVTIVEDNEFYIVYSWYMTIHVYDLKPDDVIAYDPNGGVVNLQSALNEGTQLTWKLIHDTQDDDNSIKYLCENDNRVGGILSNDIYRVPLYKFAVDPHMGTCADIIGIAYAGSGNPEFYDGSQLEYADTYASRYGVSAMALDDTGAGSEDETNADAAKDGIAKAEGNGGVVTVSLNTTRDTHINRTQDHANYAEVSFTPQQSMGRAAAGDDVFFYKVMVLAEDSTYQFTSYDQIDASAGVVMYTYFTMRPTTTGELTEGDQATGEQTLETSAPETLAQDQEEATNHPDVIDENGNIHFYSPKTKDKDIWMLCSILLFAAMSCLALATSVKKD